jgi:ABC-2 type transport system ATP-binding protein
MRPDSGIVLDRLTKRYGERRGIEEVSLRVDAGEVFGFLGPNGAGKTTTIRTMLDLLRPTEGKATLLGLDSHRDTLEAIAASAIFRATSPRIGG